ncbi:MAG: hypothetical protein AB9835_08885 [Eubacteriales bacterium]
MHILFVIKHWEAGTASHSKSGGYGGTKGQAREHTVLPYDILPIGIFL